MSIKSKQDNIITFIAGGTGGHIYPALAILDEIKKTNKVIFITDERGYNYILNEKNLLNQSNFEIKIIGVISPFKKGLINKFKFLYFFISSFIKLTHFYFKYKPKTQIGFGGYTTILPCLIGKFFFKVEYFIHEQNAIMGRANKILEPFSSKTFIPFEKIIPLKHSNKRIYSGTPIRKEIKSIKIKKRNDNKLNILVFGGSLGSEFFSISLVNSFINLNPKVKKQLNVFHQVINSKIKKVKQLYRINNVMSEVKSFFPNIEKYYKKTDLIICRAGGSTIAEILYLKIPCIIIPLKNSMDNHQAINCKIINDNKLGWVIDEDNFENDTLKKIIEDIITKNLHLDKIKVNLEKFKNENDRKKKYKSPNEILSKHIIK